jgi:hypothetical protein
MGDQILQSSVRGVWALVREQHDLVARRQLLELGYSPKAIKHRVAKGRLHSVGWGVYAVGTPHLTRYGRWMAAVLTCGPDAALSHESAAALFEIRPNRGGEIEVSVPARLATPARRRGTSADETWALGGHGARGHPDPARPARS